MASHWRDVDTGSALTWELSCDWGLSVLTVQGAIDRVTYPGLADGVLAAIGAGRAGVAVDMNGVDLCCPSGMKVLHFGAEHARAVGQELQVVADPGTVFDRILRAAPQTWSPIGSSDIGTFAITLSDRQRGQAQPDPI